MAVSSGQVQHFTLTLTGAVQTLDEVWSAAGGALSDRTAAGVKLALRSISLQADPANANVVYIGGENAAVSSSNYMWILPKPVTSIPSAPLIFGDSLMDGPLKLRRFSVLGTANEKLHIGIFLL